MKTHTITSQLAKFGVLFALTLVIPASAPSSYAAPRDAQRACHRVALKGTIMSKFDYAIMSWAGHALISFDGGATKVATMVTTGGTLLFKEDGAPYGTELNKFILEDGTFEISARWESSWSGTPGLLDLYEVGQLQNGTGAYAGIAGPVVTVGPFLSPMPPTPGVDAQFIGEMYGLVRGLAE